MAKRQTFTAEFKREAVRLLEQADNPAAEIALDLGIRRNQLYKWRDQLADKGDTAFSGSGRPRKDQESEISRLKRELAEADTVPVAYYCRRHSVHFIHMQMVQVLARP